MKQLTREQQAVYNFQVAASLLRPVTETDQNRDAYINFYDYFTSAISNFIDTELNFRQGSRCDVLDIQPNLKTYSNEMGAYYNQNGIDALTNSLTAFNLFKNAQTNMPETDEDFQTVLENYKSRLQNELVKLEIKGSDTDELNQQINLALDTLAIGNSGADLLDFTASKIQDLIDVRDSSTRGAETNIATWKLIAACVLLGLGIWVVYKCYYSTFLCSKTEQAIYNLILIIAMIVYGACE